LWSPSRYSGFRADSSFSSSSLTAHSGKRISKKRFCPLSERRPASSIFPEMADGRSGGISIGRRIGTAPDTGIAFRQFIASRRLELGGRFGSTMRSCCRIRAMLRLLIKRRPICFSGSPKMPNQQSIADSSRLHFPCAPIPVHHQNRILRVLLRIGGGFI